MAPGVAPIIFSACSSYCNFSAWTIYILMFLSDCSYRLCTSEWCRGYDVGMHSRCLRLDAPTCLLEPFPQGPFLRIYAFFSWYLLMFWLMSTRPLYQIVGDLGLWQSDWVVRWCFGRKPKTSSKMWQKEGRFSDRLGSTNGHGLEKQRFVASCQEK